MKKLFALVLIIGSFGYVWMQRGLATPVDATAASETSEVSTPTTELFKDDDTVPAKAPATSAVTTNPQTTSAPTPTYKDGTYTGKPASEPYGTVQVAVVIKGGKITQVNLLQRPSDGPRAVEVNARALPLLVQETIAAQNAQIDAVSGASLTSPVFIESLKSALSQAKA